MLIALAIGGFRALQVIWRSDPTEKPVTMTIAAGDSIVAGVTLAPDDPTLTYRPQECTLSASPT